MTPSELFARGIWTFIADDRDASWVHAVAQEPLKPDSPMGDRGVIIKRMLDAGVSAQDIARLCKIEGFIVAVETGYHLDDPNASYEGFDDAERKYFWTLQAFDEATEQPAGVVNCTGGLLTSMDPAGREMKPPGRGT